LAPGHLEEFLQLVRLGSGTELRPEVLDSFVSILPTEVEATAFKERLADQGLDSFGDLDKLKPPYVLKKLEGPANFVIRLLKEETLIEKARIMHKIDQMTQLLEQCFNTSDAWAHLAVFLMKNQMAERSDASVKHWLQEVLCLALQISR